MDIFYSRYYKVNTVCLRRLGLWPHDDESKNKVKQVTVVVLIVSIIIPQIIRFFEELNKDIDIVIEVAGSLMYFSGSQIKYISFMMVQSKMKFLYEEIARHWTLLNSEREQKILKKFGEEGRFITLLYLIPINIILVIYITVPLMPVFLDIIEPLNYTRQRMFPYFAEYFIDDQKYYFELTVHCWIVCILSVQIFGTFDTTYAQCVQHARALFAIVEYRLDKTMKLKRNAGNSRDQRQNDDEVYAETIEAVLVHKQAIKFSNSIDKSTRLRILLTVQVFPFCFFSFVSLIEQCYTHVFFWVLTLNTMLLSLTAVDTMFNLEKGNYKQMVRIGTLYIGFSVHLLFNVIPGQKVVDSSTKIQEAAFHCEWFDNSPKTKKLINIMMMRAAVPCTFTAKGLCVLDLETFAFVFKKSISYVTMIGSMR